MSRGGLAVALAIPVLILAAAGVSQAIDLDLDEDSPVTYTQHRELLASVHDNLALATTITIARGTIGGSAFDPAPEATLEVTGRHDPGGTPGTSWDVSIHDAAGLTLATVAHPYNATSFAGRTAEVSWPAVATEIAQIRITPRTGLQGVTGTFDLRKVTLRLSQNGTIVATAASFPLAPAITTLAPGDWTDAPDAAIYRHPEPDEIEDAPAFDPAPHVTMALSGDACGLGARLVSSIDDDGDAEEDRTEVVGGSELTLSGPGSVRSAALDLQDGGIYRTQVRYQPCASGPATASVHAIDLDLAQQGTDQEPVARTVGFYPSITAGTDIGIANSGQPLDFRFRSPEADVPATTQAFGVAAIATTAGAADPSFDLHDHTAEGPVAVDAPLPSACPGPGLRH